MRSRTWLTLMLAATCLGITTPLKAQLFSPESFTGAAFGALTGAIVGGHHHAGTGAAIGAGAGFLLGTIAHESNRRYYGAGNYGNSAAPYGPYAYPQTYVVTTTQQAPQAAPAATQESAPPPPPPSPPPSSMSSANALFGR